MRVTIHNVGHGLCISLIHMFPHSGEYRALLWDCGRSDAFRPSQWLPGQGVVRIEHLFVTNYDEDHIKDLPCLRENIEIASLCRNPTISRFELEQLKKTSGPITSAMATLLDMMDNWPKSIDLDLLDRLQVKLGDSTYRYVPCSIPGVKIVVFYNLFGHSENRFHDTNNISLVTFLYCEVFNRKRCYLISGDVETAGWYALLAHPEFCRRLKDVDIFVASHHGRKTGYCKDLFAPGRCSPQIVVVSDGPIQFGTQEGMASTYGRHATGIQQLQGQHRRVLTTRSGRPIVWENLNLVVAGYR